MSIEYSEAQDPNLELTDIINPEVSEEIVTADPMFEEPIINEGVEVAGPGNMAARIGRKVFGEAADVINPPKPKPKVDLGTAVKSESEPLVTVSGNDVIVRSASADELQSLQAFAKDADASLDIILPNLTKIGLISGKKPVEPMSEAETELKRLIAATFNTYKDSITNDKRKILRKGNRGFEQIVAEAEEINAVDIFIDLMQRKPGDRPFTDSEILASRRTVLSLQTETIRLLKQAKQTNSILDKVKAAQAISLEGFASIQLVGIQEDIGRTLVTQKIIASPSKERIMAMRTLLGATEADLGPSATIGVDNAIDFLDAYGGEAGVDLVLAMYDALPVENKHNFARRSVMRRGADMLVEIYTSALLSNPLTHSFNLSSNFVMMELQVVERLLEGRPSEALAMLTAQAKYAPQAFRAAWHALKTENSLTDNTSKLDIDMRAISRAGAGLRNTAEGGGKMESVAAGTFDIFGVLMRMAGYRPMITMDEFSKSLARGMQIEAISVRAKNEAYKANRKQFKTRKESKEAATAAYLKVLHSESAFEEGREFAKMVTFQDELPELLRKPMGLVSHPIMKIWLPFYKTPSQIIRRIAERTPLALLHIPNVKNKLINGSNAERREMMSKIAFGSTLMGTLATMGKGAYFDDVVMTGYGPTIRGERSRWLENHKPYSIGIRQGDGSFDWISYERYDPISGLIAMAMDAADAFEYSDDDALNDDLAITLGLSTIKYITTALPMVQFIGEFMDIAGSKYETSKDKRDRIRQLLTKQVGTAGMVVGQSVTTLGLGTNSLTATFERYMNPGASSTMPENQYDYVEHFGFQPEIRGFYEALNQMRSRIPGLSDELPSKKNRWYETVMQTDYTLENGQARGNVWQTFLPYKVRKLPGANIINQEFEALGFGLPNLPRNMGEPRLKLNGEQYDRFIELYNNPNASLEFEQEFPLATQQFTDVILSSDYISLPSIGKKIDYLRMINTQRISIAKDIMIMEYPELGALRRQRDKYKEETGRNPSNLYPPTSSEVSEFLDTLN
tara:strand:- start:715 stop:3783 length:3069 start_codon:yes stop_codon:yes gene_type:complete